MTKSKMNEFRKGLEHKQAELGNGNKNREVITIESSSDEMDRIQHASERDSAIDMLERSSNRLNEVRQALRRMEAGAYGVCTGCEEDINLKRLAAVPWASMCIVCQESADHEENSDRSEFDTPLQMTA